MKGNIFLGTARGRMGDVVAKIRHGKQIISKYQPNVLNPKSFKQMQQRELFSNATAFTKDFLSDGLLNSVYATTRGATKSLFLNVNQAKIYQLRAYEGDLTNVNKIATPMMQKIINENNFSLNYGLSPDQKGIVPLINGVPPTGGKIYFGSISELSGDKFVCKGLGISGVGLIGAKSELSISLSVVPEEGARQYGFQNTPEDCGIWPFIYEVTMPTTDGKETNIITFDETLINNVIPFTNVHLFFFDNKQNAIGYVNVMNPELLPDAP